MVYPKHTIFLLWLCLLQQGLPESLPVDDLSNESLRRELLALRNEVTQLRQEVRQNREDRLVQTDEAQRGNFPDQDRSRRLLLPLPVTTHTVADKAIRIAFSANRPMNFSNLTVHQALVFGGVISNVGNCYHHVTGIFNPSVSGMYVFDVHIIQCAPHHDVRTELVVEGVPKTGTYAGTSTGCANGGGFTVVHVNAGDSVWVRLSTSDGVNVFGWETSFSGYLLYED